MPKANNDLIHKCFNKNIVMTEKEAFVEKIKKRTKMFAVDIFWFCDSLKSSKSST